MPFDLGDTVRLAAECRDAGGTLADADTATLTVTLPDGTTATPTVADPAEAGLYVHDFIPTQDGRHSVRWVFTGPATAYADVFDVRPAAPPLIMSLADAKAHLNLKTTRDDVELRAWVEAVTELVQNLTGVSVRHTRTETHHLPLRCVTALALHRSPVLEVTAVNGEDIDSGSYEIDPAAGILYGCFAGPTTVSYVAGRTVVPAAVTAGAKIILQHLWQSVRTGSRSPTRGQDDVAMVAGFGYAIPNRALQLLEPHRLPPGVG